MCELLQWSAYCSRDAGAELRLLRGQHGQSSCSSFPQPLVLLSAVEHEQLQAIVPCGQVQLLHLRSHQTATVYTSTFQHIRAVQ